MFGKLLVPLDGSPEAAVALAPATALAAALGAAVRLVRVAPSGDDAAFRDAVGDLAAVERELGAAGLDAASVVRDGDPAAEIVAEVRAAGADLVVMSTRGRSGLARALLGSVADQLLRRSPVPVLLIPPGADPAWPPDGARRVLVPLDGSPLAEQALGPAAALAGALRAETVLLSVVVPPPLGYGYFADRDGAFDFKPERELAGARAYLERVVGRPELGGRPTEIRTAVGTAPGRAITDTARELGVHAVAMATHGYGRATRAVMGSVAAEVVRLATVPVLVLVVRPAGGTTA